jgi:ribosome-associated protein YbcJ (S4-like RNA binding protein)
LLIKFSDTGSATKYKQSEHNQLLHIDRQDDGCKGEKMERGSVVNVSGQESTGQGLTLLRVHIINLSSTTIVSHTRAAF